MKKVIFSLLAALCFAACSQDYVQEASSSSVYIPDQISVGFENDDTRIQLSNGKTVWNEADRISVFYQSFDNLMWEFQGVDGDRTGTFELIDGQVGKKMMDDVIVVYPYNADYLVNVNTKSVEASIPALQNYYPESYDPESNLMISLGDDSSFVLKNVSGWVKIQLTGNGEEVQYITLRGNNDELLAGDVYLSASDASLSFASGNDSSADDDLEVGGDLVFNSAEQKSITLECHNTTLSSEPKAFYIALAPQNFENGFTVEVKCKGYAPMVLNNTAATTIERNHIKPMEAVAFEGESVAEYDVLFEAPLLNGQYYGTTFSEAYNYFTILTNTGAFDFSSLQSGEIQYRFDIFSDVPAGNAITVPYGVYTFDKYSTNDAGTFAAAYSCHIDNSNNQVEEYKFEEGTLVVTENYIEALLLIENGEWHKVTYSGGLYLGYEESDYLKIGVVGSFTGWGDDIFMTYDIESGLHCLTGLSLNKGDEFKLRQGSNWELNWGANGQSYINANSYIYLAENGNNIIVREDGCYDIYFNRNRSIIYFMETGVDYGEAVADYNDDDVDDDVDEDDDTEVQVLEKPLFNFAGNAATWFELEWDPVENAAGYRAYYYSHYDTNDLIYVELDADTTKYRFDNLTAGSYTFAVSAIAAEGSGYSDSEWAELPNLWISGNPQLEVDWFSVDVYSKTNEEEGLYPHNSMFLTWSGSDVKILMYGLHPYPASMLIDQVGWKSVYASLSYGTTDFVSPEGMEHYIEDLDPSTLYTFITYAVNNDGEEFVSFIEYTTESAGVIDNVAKRLGKGQAATYKILTAYDENRN